MRKFFVLFICGFILVAKSNNLFATDFNLTLNTGWNFVTIPLSGTQPPSSALGAFNYVIYSWNTAQNKFQDVSGDTSFTPGKGYWVYVQSEQNSVVSGAAASGSQTISLSIGWNAVGNPFDGALSISSLTVDSQPFVSSSKVAGEIYYWDGTQYQEASSFNSGRGFWVKALQNCSLTFPVPIPNDPPTAITLSTPSGATTSSLNLSWTQNQDTDFASYKVYRSTSSGVSQSSTLAATITSKTTTTKTVTELSSGTTHYFKVYVCDNGDPSLCTGSNEVSGATSINNPPSAVTLSTSSGATTSSLNLSWTQNQDTDFASYKVYLSTSSGVNQSSTIVATITSKTTKTKTVTELSSGTTHYFKVYVCDTGIPSLCTGSNEVSGNTSTGGNPLVNEWITIPSGEFIMGCATGDTQCAASESPKHTVTLSQYNIQKNEVTNAQYKACVDAGTCTSPSSTSSNTHSSWKDQYFGNETYNDYPVIYVDWNQAKTYCGWIGGRLPTEAEWEKAARGPSPSEVLYPWGNEEPTCSLVNTTFHVSCVGDTSAVGSYPAGASYYGVLDMAGNVWEWMEDDWHSSYTGAPTDGSAWVDNPRGADRVSRSGSWYWNSMSTLRVSARGSGYLAPPNLTSFDLGFRCAKDVSLMNDPPIDVTLSTPSEATTNSLNLSWTQNQDMDFASYKIYRSTSASVSETSTIVDTITSKTTTIITVTGLSAGTTYYFTVYVCDTGNPSLCTGSNVVSGTTTGNCTGGWCTIPSGDFVMGCVDNDPQFCGGDSPKHTVNVSAFKIQKYEVTNAQYKVCVNSGACSAPSSSVSQTRSSYYGNTSYDNYPVINVNWYQAKSYCEWIGGWLPTEAEWEKAARGPSPREVIYPWGNDVPTCSLVNAFVNSSCVGDTSAVGSYPSGASYYGVLDMAGNVWEWVEDDFHVNYVGAPTDGSAWVDNPRGSLRIVRGGDWGGFQGEEYIRISHRMGFEPLGMDTTGGFRCAKD